MSEAMNFPLSTYTHFHHIVYFHLVAFVLTQYYTEMLLDFQIRVGKHNAVGIICPPGRNRVN